jgi:hypothetical protein
MHKQLAKRFPKYESEMSMEANESYRLAKNASVLFKFWDGDDDVFAEAWRRGLILPAVGLFSAASALASIRNRDPTPPAGARIPHVLYSISSPKYRCFSSPPLTSSPASPGSTVNTVSATPRSYSIFHHSNCQISETTPNPGWYRSGGRRPPHGRNAPHGHEKGKYSLTSDKDVKC